MNERQPLRSEDITPKKTRRKRQPEVGEEISPKKARRKRQTEIVDEKIVYGEERRHHKTRRRRDVSGALLEEGDGRKLRGMRGGARYPDQEQEELDEASRQKRKRLCKVFFSIFFWKILIRV